MQNSNEPARARRAASVGATQDVVSGREAVTQDVVGVREAVTHDVVGGREACRAGGVGRGRGLQGGGSFRGPLTDPALACLGSTMQHLDG